MPMLTLKNLFYVLVFGVVMYVAIQQALEMGDSREWPTTEGVIRVAYHQQPQYLDGERLARQPLRVRGAGTVLVQRGWG
jgi:hypothetical protein